ARLVRTLDAPTVSGTPFKTDSTYLLTGGLGALGLQVAAHMIEAGARDLVLLQRSKLPPRTAWAEVEPGSRVADQIGAILELESKGGRVHVFSADVAQGQQVESVLREIATSLPPLRGIVHAAGVLDDGILSQMNQQRFMQVMAPKVAGAWNLHCLTLNLPLD